MDGKKLFLLDNCRTISSLPKTGFDRFDRLFYYVFGAYTYRYGYWEHIGVVSRNILKDLDDKLLYHYERGYSTFSDVIFDNELEKVENLNVVSEKRDRHYVGIGVFISEVEKFNDEYSDMKTDLPPFESFYKLYVEKIDLSFPSFNLSEKEEEKIMQIIIQKSPKIGEILDLYQER